MSQELYKSPIEISQQPNDQFQANSRIFFLLHPTYLNNKFHKVAQTENIRYTRANVLWVWKILEWEINYPVWDQDNIAGVGNC